MRDINEATEGVEDRCTSERAKNFRANTKQKGEQYEFPSVDHPTDTYFTHIGSTLIYGISFREKTTITQFFFHARFRLATKY
jgi:hypothetical protein